MKINFTQILQDSWNFFRNQQKTMFQFVSILFMVQVFNILLSPPIASIDTALTVDTLPQLMEENASSIAFSFLITQLVTTFIASWGLMTISQISRQNHRTLAQSFQATLPRFLGVVILDLIAIMPILLGLSEILAAVLMKTSPSIISLAALIFGMGFFIRLNLSTTHYLTTQDSIGHSLRKIWLQGKNQKTALLIYALLVYFVTPILIFQLSAIFNHLIFSVFVGILAAALNIFMLVVTYRFYSLFMKES
ncbi:hypothetical protein BKK49_00155 [Rodentibacter rarus]|uniref:Beta-methylgalactoside transporter n=1 Tax=Rodentibacter rarus TaxID=1908260 RepID=A0A1V3ITI2_9PAST|nr:hypothetical protein [Rodentibacter rarus]OOF43634.1 hypothetical protein BKK49_00155 [Rodentibacter rarus]OOF45350.1 hypothetical protein BKK50_00155 [Rodentibacter rarus]